MTIEEIVRAIAGGVLVGTAAGVVLTLNGRIAGISGMLASMVRREGGENVWQPVFLLGPAVGGGLLLLFDPEAVPGAQSVSSWTVLLAGLLVGSHCTHG